MAKTDCPNCGYTINHHTNPHDPTIKPRPGDLSVCLDCQHILIFGEDGESLLLPTDEQIQEMKNDPELWNTVQRYRWIIKETLPPNDTRGSIER